ncbi:HlyD family type I secretion periplasmic adaptor subunit [Porticoccaceae bacterium]|jgi:adhesin transport system membrane fusion protein|nr:HlyD family type I secretion periplasmic adaptor subunit [Porticoccaceae bacterium]
MNPLWFFRSAEASQNERQRLNEELRGSRWVLWAVFVALCSFFIWANFSEIDQITRAQGSVIPSSNVQLIQSKNGGVLKQLPVSVGDIVDQGQIIAQFEETNAEADYQEAKAQVAALSAAMSRLTAELFGASPEFSELANEFPHFVRSQKSLFDRRQSAKGDEIKNLDAILALVREEIEMNEPLLANGDVSKTEILRLQREEAELVAKRGKISNDYFQATQAEYNETEEEFERVSQLLIQRQIQLDGTTLTAPVKGIVKSIRLTTVGGVIRPGEDVLEIVPLEDDLMIEAKVAPQDIGFLRVGMDVSVKIDAYDYTIYGDLNGVLSYISADTLEENTQRGDVPFYRVHVRTQGRKFSGRPDAELQILPGMTATVEVKTGKNTVLSYLLKPIVKTLRESMGER